jgi:spore coat polysaccharide biosynthesis protein SpsF (cytidylyltransferase family)
MNIVVIIQARVGSTRLPGKIMKRILGKTVLIHDLDRIKEMKTINKIVVATTDLEEDDIIVKAVKGYDGNIGTYRGSESDVLDRYYKAAKEFNADVIVRITSDCPLIDPNVSDLVVEAFLKNDCDYCCNTLPRTFPHGLDTEVFSLDALERVWEEAKSPYEREHVTPYIREDTNKFRRINVKNNDDLTHLRWTLDYPEDFEFITKIYERLYSKKKIFYMQDILNVLHAEHWLVEINSKYVNR